VFVKRDKVLSNVIPYAGYAILAFDVKDTDPVYFNNVADQNPAVTIMRVRPNKEFNYNLSDWIISRTNLEKYGIFEMASFTKDDSVITLNFSNSGNYVPGDDSDTREMDISMNYIREVPIVSGCKLENGDAYIPIILKHEMSEYSIDDYTETLIKNLRKLNRVEFGMIFPLFKNTFPRERTHCGEVFNAQKYASIKDHATARFRFRFISNRKLKKLINDNLDEIKRNASYGEIAWLPLFDHISVVDLGTGFVSSELPTSHTDKTDYGIAVCEDHLTVYVPISLLGVRPRYMTQAISKMSNENGIRVLDEVVDYEKRVSHYWELRKAPIGSNMGSPANAEYVEMEVEGKQIHFHYDFKNKALLCKKIHTVDETCSCLL
jgi:hypothetical protein